MPRSLDRLYRKLSPGWVFPAAITLARACHVPAETHFPKQSETGPALGVSVIPSGSAAISVLIFHAPLLRWCRLVFQFPCHRDVEELHQPSFRCPPIPAWSALASCGVLEDTLRMDTFYKTSRCVSSCMSMASECPC